MYTRNCCVFYPAVTTKRTNHLSLVTREKTAWNTQWYAYLNRQYNKKGGITNKSFACLPTFFLFQRIFFLKRIPNLVKERRLWSLGRKKPSQKFVWRDLGKLIGFQGGFFKKELRHIYIAAHWSSAGALTTKIHSSWEKILQLQPGLPMEKLHFTVYLFVFLYTEN